MIQHNTVHHTIREFIIDSFLFDKSQAATLPDDLSLIDQGILDSFGLQEMLFFLEREFKIKVEDEEVVAENMHSIDAIVGFVLRKLNHH